MGLGQTIMKFEQTYTPTEREQLFQKYMSHYYTYHDKESRNGMWLCVYDSCLVVVKKIIKVSNINTGSKLHAIDIESIALDASTYLIDCMDRLGNRPNKLGTFCYAYVKKFMWDKKAQEWDRSCSLEGITEGGREIAYEFDFDYEEHNTTINEDVERLQYTLL